MATRDCGAVLETVPPPKPGPPASNAVMDEQLAAAWCANQLGRHEDALTRLEGLPKGPLDAYVQWQRGLALVGVGRREEAATALDGLVLPESLAADAHFARAQALPDPAARAKALASLFDGPRGRDAKLLAASLAGEEGGRARQVELLRQVWVDGSPGGQDTLAESALADLGEPLWPDGEAGLTLRRARAKSLRRAYRNDEALPHYEALHTGATSKEARLALADARSRARDHAGAIELWAQVYGAPEAAAGPPEALFTYALSHARMGDYASAAVVYRRLFAAHPTHKKADFASFKLGYMAWDEGRVDDAVAELSAHLERYPQSAHLDEALWFRAMVRYDSDRKSALTDLRRLRTERGSSALAAGAAYWIAMDAEERGIPEGKEALRKVMLNWPTSGYAWFAAARIGHRFPQRDDAVVPAPTQALASHRGFERARRLTAVGLRPWARAELATVKGGGADILPLAWARLEAGDYKGAKKLACPKATKPWKDGDPVAMQACYPRPERRLVEAVAARYGLDPAIPYGVMVAESGLDPEVTSPAGARGLMQLMPEVGERLHPTLFPERPFAVDDLYAGPYNAALGTLELGERTQSLKGLLDISSVPAVVASYNGGEEAVRRWTEAAEGPPPFDRWAESISYTETRRYVKRVLGFSMALRWVYGDAEQ